MKYGQTVASYQHYREPTKGKTSEVRLLTSTATTSGSATYLSPDDSLAHPVSFIGGYASL